MKSRDAALITKFVLQVLDATSTKAVADLAAAFEELATDPEGKPGTGACICNWTPEKFKAHCERMNVDPMLEKGVMQLDHRCAHHGEKAQPTLWGRHKEKELMPTWLQWASLGVERAP